MIHSIKINDFRLLKNVEIILGRYITAISGRNGVGKSTILALLGNACEIKIKEGRTLFNTQFRTEFSEIFKASKKFDKSGSNKCEINFCDFNNVNEITETKICRTTWQNNGQRFRIIPETKSGLNKNSKKMNWPSLYLGLSRLYPIGEVKDEEINIKNINLKEDEEYFIKNYKEILNLNFDEENNINVDMINIGDNKRKKGIGINTDKYDSKTNSAGQDNVGQIITAILSFKKLKEQNSNYKGGLLLIDEIDATLHPSAQTKLISFLYNSAKELNLQIVFTTHSVSMLEYICQKAIKNDNNVMNDFEIYYCTNANGPIKFYRNLEFTSMKSDLNLSMPGSNIDKIAIYSEDKEARWMLNKLIPQKYSMYVRCIDCKLPCSVLLQLNKNDPLYFANIIFVLDGDVQEQDIVNNNNNGNLIKLPGNKSPEKVIYDFLINLEDDSELWENGFRFSFTKETIREYGPYSDKYKGKDREKLKSWFNDNLQMFEALKVFDYWAKKNTEEKEKFLKAFVKAYNKIAKRNLQITI